MRQAEAKQKLIQEFDEWKHNLKFIEKPTEWDAYQFYSHIYSKKPILLNFSCRDDKWQKIKSWLYESSRIRSN